MTPPRSAVDLAKEMLAVQCAPNQRAATPRTARSGSGSELAREQHHAHHLPHKSPAVVECTSRVGTNLCSGKGCTQHADFS
jgi:hypothetical protein